MIINKKLTQLLKREIKENDRVLDVGCGSFHIGEFITHEILLKRGLYVGIDHSISALALAEKKCKKALCDTLFFYADITEYKQTHIKDHSLDVILLFHILHEYLHNQAMLHIILVEIFSLLKIGGVVILYDFRINKEDGIFGTQVPHLSYTDILEHEQLEIKEHIIDNAHECLVIKKILKKNN